MSPAIRRIAVITGDHGLADPTKREGRYHDEDERTHEAMTEALRSLPGYEVRVLSAHRSLLDDLRRDPPDLAVNFCDTGFGNVPTQELHVPAYLELLGIPYTGAPPAAMAICYDKALVRQTAAALGVPVPREVYLPAGDPPDCLGPDGLTGLLPALIKPNTGDGSVGITKDAVVGTREEALAYLRWLRSALPDRDVLIQEYLPGAEYGVGLIGNPDTGLTMLPPLEVDFADLPAELTPILSFESKAVPDSPYWTEIKFKQARLAPALEARLEGWCRALFRRFGLRDYARFDFRVGADGEVKLMEVNPNPAWAYDGKLALMAGFAGIVYRDMLRLILDAAMARLARKA